jgi:probable rRNA maturation factor
LHGELFICLDDAVAQAREFRTTWQAELARYVIHGVLHLRGFDDTTPAARRKMKRAENALLRGLARRLALARLARRTRRGS